MNVAFDPQDIEALTHRLLEVLKPYLSRPGKPHQEDDILDVQGLCGYLKVTPKWVYDQTHLKSIPSIKLSNKVLRFRRSEIDKWLANLKTPAIDQPTSKFRLLK